MLRPPSLSNILLRFGSLNFWLIILICHRYSNVFLWFLVGFHGFQGIFKLLSLPHFHFLPFAMINRKMLLVNNWQFCSGSPDASMSTVLLPPYFHFLSLTTKKINSDCLNIQALMMLQCQQCSCFFHNFTCYRLQG